MRPTRLAPLAALAAAATLAACGSTGGGRPAATPTTTPKARLSLVAAADEGMPAIAPVRPLHYVLDGDLPDLGATAPVYRLVGHDVTDADVVRIARALGMDAAPTRTDSGYEVRAGDALLNVDTSAGTTTIDYSREGNASPGSAGGSAGAGGAATPPSPPDAVNEPVPMPTTPPPVDVPNADDAARIAQSLLDDFGVLGDQQWDHDMTDAAGVAVSCPADVPCNPPVPAPEVSARTVTFSLVVDGVRLADVTWSVTVGSHGRVDAVSGAWAQPEPAGTYPLRSTTDAFADLEHGRAQYPGVQPLAAEAAGDVAPAGANTAVDAPAPEPAAPTDAHVTGVALGRARWDGLDDNTPVAYVVPTYRFHTRVDGADPYDVEVLALAPTSFTIAAAPRPEPAVG